MELFNLSDRMDLTLRRFLELQEAQGDGAMDALATSAADFALRQEEQAAGSQSQSVEEVADGWGDFAAFDCPVCFERVEEREEGLRLGCGHALCRECGREIVVTAVESAKVLDLGCSSPGCEGEFGPAQIRGLLDASGWARYEEFALLACLAADSNVKWCPEAGCGNAVVVETGEAKVHCAKCGKNFCALCNDEWHLGTCESFEEWKEQNGKVDVAFKKWAKANTVACPKCKIKVQRSQGCMHMTCKCGAEFCYICGRTCGPNHFSAFNLLGCPGLQFAEEESLTVPKRVGFRVLCGAGIIVGVPLVAALIVPAAIVGGTIYGSYRLHKYRKMRMRMKKWQ